MPDRRSNPPYGLDNDTVRDICTKLLARVEALPISRDIEQRRTTALLALAEAETLAQAHPGTPLSDALAALAGEIKAYIIVGAPVDLAAQHVREALDRTLGNPTKRKAGSGLLSKLRISSAGSSKTERVSNARYGGLSNAAVSEVCTKLLDVAATLPDTDNFEKRREAAHISRQTASTLAQADPHTPLSDALYALAAALDLYIHFRQRVGHEAGDVRSALDETMR